MAKIISGTPVVTEHAQLQCISKQDLSMLY